MSLVIRGRLFESEDTPRKKKGRTENVRISTRVINRRNGIVLRSRVHMERRAIMSLTNEPIVVQEVMYKREDFPKAGEVMKFMGRHYRVMMSQIHLKMKKLYFVNIWLDGDPLTI